MNFNDYEELATKLNDKLMSEEYDGLSVELGENWETIAEIFYKLGFEDGSKK